MTASPRETGRLTRRATVVGVAGARGGIGATTLAALLARRCATAAARATSRSTLAPAVLVDAAGGAGVDVLLGLERDRALRWPDLHAAYGDVDGGDLLVRLPRWEGVHVLSADHSRPRAPEPEVARAVLDGLASCAEVVVVDLGTAASPASLTLAGALDCAVVLVPRDVQSVAGALVVRSGLADVPDLRLVTRRPAPGGLGPLEIAHVLDLPLLADLVGPRRGGARPRSRHETGLGPVARGRRGRRELDELRRGLGLA